MQRLTEQRITLNDSQEAFAILGRNDENLRLICESFTVKIMTRGDEITVIGNEDEVDKVAGLFNELLYIYRSGNAITVHDVRYSIRMIKEGQGAHLHQMFADTVLVTARGRHIKPKTLGQKRYLEAIRHNHVTFGIGPAGTGKTYLAVAMAAFSLK
ncbi:MAG: PhoH family protein, partial [Negativicutes bacterium]